MKRQKKVILVSLAACILSIGMCNFVSARYLSKYDYTINYFNATNTLDAYKLSNDTRGYNTLTYNATQVLSNLPMKYRMLTENGANASDVEYIETTQTKYFNHRGTFGNGYHLTLWEANLLSPCRVVGYWSPDVN